MPWRTVTRVALLGVPSMLAIHAAVWGFVGLLSGSWDPWIWPRELFGAVVMSFVAFFGLAL